MAYSNAPGAHLARKTGYLALTVLTLLAWGVVLCEDHPAAVAPDRDDEAIHQFYQGRIDLATARLRRSPADPRLCSSLACLKLARANLLALGAYEREQRPIPGEAFQATEGYCRWRCRYLATDPENALTDALRVVRHTLRSGPPTRQRLALASIEARALCSLGRHREEVGSLRRAVSLAPNREDFVRRLAWAYAEARQFRQAEAVLRAGDWPAIGADRSEGHDR